MYIESPKFMLSSNHVLCYRDDYKVTANTLTFLTDLFYHSCVRTDVNSALTLNLSWVEWSFCCLCGSGDEPTAPPLADRSTEHQQVGLKSDQRELGYLAKFWVLVGICLILRQLRCRWAQQRKWQIKCIKKGEVMVRRRFSFPRGLCGGQLSGPPSSLQQLRLWESGNPGFVPEDSLISPSSSASLILLPGLSV